MYKRYSGPEAGPSSWIYTGGVRVRVPRFRILDGVTEYGVQFSTDGMRYTAWFRFRDLVLFARFQNKFIEENITRSMVVLYNFPFPRLQNMFLDMEALLQHRRERVEKYLIDILEPGKLSLESVGRILRRNQDFFKFPNHFLNMFGLNIEPIADDLDFF